MVPVRRRRGRMAKCLSAHNTQWGLLGTNMLIVEDFQKVQRHGAHTIFKGDTFRCFHSELQDFLLLKFKLSPFPQFVFEYETGWETGAVIALDDFSISRGSCFSPPVDPPVVDDGDDYGNLKLHSAVSILLFLIQEIRTGQFGKFCLVNRL